MEDTIVHKNILIKARSVVQKQNMGLVRMRPWI
jgi:hypothetical protein